MPTLSIGKRLALLARRDAGLAVIEVEEGRFQRSMAAVTAFSAIVSGFEAYVQHQRGAFNHWLMWTPVWLTPPRLSPPLVTHIQQKEQVGCFCPLSRWCRWSMG